MRKRGLWLGSIALLLVILIITSACTAPAEFEVTSLDVVPPEATVGEAVNVTAEVRNIGASEGTYTAVLTVDGAEVERKEITLAAGATESVTFSLVRDTPGTYQIGIGGLVSTLVVGETAKIEISFNPNPVPCEDGDWHWRVRLTEVNGIGVQLNNLVYERYYGDSVVNRKEFDSSWIEEWLDSAYLPAHGSSDFGAGFPCQAVSYAIFGVTGIDDDGHEITAEGRVDFLQP